jgi:hypothetical protein
MAEGEHSGVYQQPGKRLAKSKAWSDSPRVLSGRLRQAATFLRKVGIGIGFEREGQARTRIIRITAILLAADGQGFERPYRRHRPQ